MSWKSVLPETDFRALIKKKSMDQSPSCESASYEISHFLFMETESSGSFSKRQCLVRCSQLVF
jgi:hypothetical protein